MRGGRTDTECTGLVSRRSRCRVSGLPRWPRSGSAAIGLSWRRITSFRAQRPGECLAICAHSLCRWTGQPVDETIERYLTRPRPYASSPWRFGRIDRSVGWRHEIAISSDPPELLPLLAESGRCGLSLVGEPLPNANLAGVFRPTCNEGDVSWLPVEDGAEIAHCDSCGCDFGLDDQP